MRNEKPLFEPSGTIWKNYFTFQFHFQISITKFFILHWENVEFYWLYGEKQVAFSSASWDNKLYIFTLGSDPIDITPNESNKTAKMIPSIENIADTGATI